MELSAHDIDKAKFVFSIYDFDGKDRIDGYNLGDCLRSLDLTPSLKMITKLGGKDNRGEQFYTIAEFLSIFCEAKKDKNVGCLEDYIELLKCYDKHNDGYMPASQLNQILLASGERMSNGAVELIMNECCDAPDEDGYIKYIPFVTKVCSGPPSAFDNVDFKLESSLASPQNATPRKLRPSITVNDADAPTVSFAAAMPMSIGRKSSIAVVAEENPETSFTLKTSRRSSSIIPPED